MEKFLVIHFHNRISVIVNQENDSELSDPTHVHLHPFKKTVENDSKSTHRKTVHLNEESEG
jgi:hypothetical protein